MTRAHRLLGGGFTMSYTGTIVCTILIGCASALVQGSSGGQGGQGKELDAFKWLTGTWEATEGKSIVEEVWTAPSSNVMIGLSRTVDDGRTSSFEFLRLEKRGADLFYVPQPGGRPPVSFKMTSDAGGRYVFEHSGEDRV